MKIAWSLILGGLVLLLSAVFLAGCAQTATPAPTSLSPTATFAPDVHPADGPTLMQDRCSECHSIALIESARGSAQDWQALVDRMVNFGAELSPQEQQVLVQYLAQTYHP